MKAVRFFIVCTFLSTTSSAQLLADDCNFETPCPYLQPLNGDNIWQVAAPEKPVINVANSPNFCVVTDAFAPVGMNRNDTVQFNLPAKWAPDDNNPNAMLINFYYMHELATLKDVCKIEVAFDSSEFQNIQQLFQEQYTEFYDEFEYTLEKYTLLENDTGFTGITEDWRRGELYVFFYPAVGPSPHGWPEHDVDTVKVQFILRSDNIPEANDGFAIDDISFELLSWSSISDQPGVQTLSLFPNPAESNCTLQCSDLSNSRQQLIIRTVTGQEVKFDKYVYFDTQGKAEISLDDLVPGTYLCLIDDGGTDYRQLLIKQ